MKLLIICLRRSGSTTFWDAFKQDRRIRCYDEPFNPLFAELPRTFHKSAASSVVDLFEEDCSKFWEYFSPIPWWEELDSEMASSQLKFLEFLLNKSEHVVIDVTRCHFKVASILKVFPDVKVVYLSREPQAFISSHLLPNRVELTGLAYCRSRIRYLRQKRRFFLLRHGFDSWQMERIIGKKGGKFEQLYLNGGVDLDEASAAEKLMLYWKCVDQSLRAQMDLFPERIKHVQFETFCAEPQSVSESVYRFCGLESYEIDCTKIRLASEGFWPDASEWQKVLQVAE